MSCLCVGQLVVGFLGTKPPVAAVGGGHQRELNYDKVDEEHRRLLQVAYLDTAVCCDRLMVFIRSFEICKANPKENQKILLLSSRK